MVDDLRTFFRKTVFSLALKKEDSPGRDVLEPKVSKLIVLVFRAFCTELRLRGRVAAKFLSITLLLFVELLSEY